MSQHIELIAIFADRPRGLHLALLGFVGLGPFGSFPDAVPTPVGPTTEEVLL